MELDSRKSQELLVEKVCEIEEILKSNMCINVLTAPYNSMEFLKILVRNQVLMGKRVLYISCYFDKSLREGLGDYDNVNIVSYSEAIGIGEKYDFIIYNESSCFSEISREEIVSLLSKLINKGSKFVAISTSRLLSGCREVEIPLMQSENLFCEPRLVKTKLDFTRKIPEMLFEYLKYFMDSNKNTVIVLRSEGEFKKVRSMLEASKSLIGYESLLINPQEIMDLSKGIVLVSKDYFWKLPRETCQRSIVFCDKKDSFTTKEIVYILGRANCKNNKGEVILLTNSSWDYIDNSIKIGRRLNRRLWESKLIKS